MNGQDRSNDNSSAKAPSTDQAAAKPTPTAFRPVLGAIEARKQAEADRERQKLLKRKRQEAKTEFNAWKRNLCEIINKESQLIFDEESYTWQFVVPARLNRFFYEVMLKEYVRAKKAANEGDAAALVRAEFDQAAEAVIEAEGQLERKRKGEDHDDLAVSQDALDHEPDRAGDPADGGGVDHLGGDHSRR